LSLGKLLVALERLILTCNQLGLDIVSLYKSKYLESGLF
jgi:hypothetical protein